MEGGSALSSPTSPQAEQLVLFVLCWRGFLTFLKQYHLSLTAVMTSHCHQNSSRKKKKPLLQSPVVLVSEEWKVEECFSTKECLGTADRGAWGVGLLPFGGAKLVWWP